MASREIRGSAKSKEWQKSGENDRATVFVVLLAYGDNIGTHIMYMCAGSSAVQACSNRENTDQMVGLCTDLVQEVGEGDPGVAVSANFSCKPQRYRVLLSCQNCCILHTKCIQPYTVHVRTLCLEWMGLF